jgi:hypothetical protein
VASWSLRCHRGRTRRRSRWWTWLPRSRITNLRRAVRRPRSASMLRACWVIQGPVGCAVTPASHTRRRSNSMKNSTYTRVMPTVSTVNRSQANTRRPAPAETPSISGRRAGCGAGAGNRRWGRLGIVGECAKLGVTVSATSARNILRRHHLAIHGAKPSDPRRLDPEVVALVVRCPATDHVAVPAQQRAWVDQEHRPPLTRQQARQRRGINRSDGW